jgi:hypothetical protein
MTTTSYNIGDAVWIYGVSILENKLTQGTLVKSFKLDDDSDRTYYVISVPTAIEPLLEIRTWETISQDSAGPVGGLRDVLSQLEIDSSHKKMSQLGYQYDLPSITDADDPSPEEINAVIERLNEESKHVILKPKTTRAKPRYNNRKKKM